MQEVRMSEDEKRIRQLGGPAAVAKILGYGYVRVFQWMKRGIPAKEKVDRPDLFMPKVWRKRR